MSLNTILATAPLTTTNYILKATGTALGNSIIWDNGTNVGIGNTNTTYKLEVTGTFGVSSTSLLSGNVGIGVAASGAKLQVLGYVNDATLGNISIRTTDNINNTLIFSHSTGFADIRSNEGLKLYVGASFNTLGMTITSAGNVGIGTSSPGAKLTVATSSGETIRMIGADTIGDNYMAFFNTAGTRKGYVGYGYSNFDYFEIYQEAAEPIIISTNATERMRITSIASGGYTKISNYNAGYVNVNGNYHEINSNRGNDNIVYFGK